MRVEFDTLKCAKMLRKGGMETSYAEVMIGSFSSVEINNLYSKMEMDTMLSESVLNTLVECRREFDARLERDRITTDKVLEDRRREFDARMERDRIATEKALEERRIATDKAIEDRRREFNERAAERNLQFEKESAERRMESRSAIRWMVGTVITCTLALAGYLSTLIRLTH